MSGERKWLYIFKHWSIIWYAWIFTKHNKNVILALELIIQHSVYKDIQSNQSIQKKNKLNRQISL